MKKPLQSHSRWRPAWTLTRLSAGWGQAAPSLRALAEPEGPAVCPLGGPPVRVQAVISLRALGAGTQWMLLL